MTNHHVEHLYIKLRLQNKAGGKIRDINEYNLSRERNHGHENNGTNDGMSIVTSFSHNGDYVDCKRQGFEPDTKGREDNAIRLDRSYGPGCK